MELPKQINNTSERLVDDLKARLSTQSRVSIAAACVTTFYSHLGANARMKSLFTDCIEQIVWLYKLAPSNLHIDDGKEEQEG